MSVGVVYVYIVPSNTSCEERREAIVFTGYVILEVIFQH